MLNIHDRKKQIAILSIFYKHKRGGLIQRLYEFYEFSALENHPMYYISSEDLPLVQNRITPLIVKSPFAAKQNFIFWLTFIILTGLKSYFAVKKYEVKRIINFGPFYTVLCALPIKLRHVPALTFIRGDNMRHSQNKIRNVFFFLVDWIGIKLSKRILTNSHKLKIIYQKRYHIHDNKILVIPNNISREYMIDSETKRKIRKSLAITSEDFLLSTAGVFTEGKNFCFLIKAMKQLHLIGIKLLIIGDEIMPNGEKNRLKKLIHHLSLEKYIIFSGWQEDPSPLIASSDLFVFPSKYEGSPNALLEALGCNLPCLGSWIDEIVEVLQYEELLFPLNNDVIFINKIKKARFDAEYYSKIKYLSNTRCKHFLFDWGKEVLQAIIETE